MKYQKIIKILKDGGVGVLPTDTIYGIAGSALHQKTVLRIYKLRKRDLKKSCIVLIPSAFSLTYFGVKIGAKEKKILSKVWPGKVSIILKVNSKKFKYLTRGKNTLAFRVPAKKHLRAFLQKTGPLVAPSANLAGKKPASTIREAKKYFKSTVDFYVDAGRVIGEPSTLLDLTHREPRILRKGAVVVKI